MGAVDWLCITFSRCITVPFVYHLLVYCCVSPCVLWPGGAGGNNDNFPQNMPAALFTADGFVDANAAIVEFLAENVIAGNATKVMTAGATKTAWDANLGKTTSAIVHYAVSVILMYVTYDFFYYWFHRTLHLRSLYKFVHKHRHRQHAPTRGNLDAINVHPFEFICGEYNHLLAVSLVRNGMRAAGLGCADWRNSHLCGSRRCACEPEPHAIQRAIWRVLASLFLRPPKEGWCNTCLRGGGA